MSEDSSFPSAKPIMESLLLHCLDIMMFLIHYKGFEECGFLGPAFDDL